MKAHINMLLAYKTHNLLCKIYGKILKKMNSEF
jgi:hypothetical protein